MKIFSQSFHDVPGHLASNRASYIFKHLQDSEHCRALCSADNFLVLHHAFTGFQLKIKEAIHIRRERPSLNQQLHYPFNSHTFMFLS